MFYRKQTHKKNIADQCKKAIEKEQKIRDKPKLVAYPKCWYGCVCGGPICQTCVWRNKEPCRCPKRFNCGCSNRLGTRPKCNKMPSHYDYDNNNSQGGTCTGQQQNSIRENNRTREKLSLVG